MVTEGRWTQTSGLCLTVRNHYMTIPSCFFHGGYHKLSQRITSHSGTKESTHLLHQPGEKGIRRLKSWGFCFGQSGTDMLIQLLIRCSPLRSLVETQSKVNHQPCNYCSITGCIRTMVGFCSGLVHAAWRHMWPSSSLWHCLVVSPRVCRVLHASGCRKALPSKPAPV